MQVPQFIKELIWCFYPPRYKQLSKKKFSSSVWFMSRVLMIGFLLASLFFIPKVALLKSDIETGLEQFSAFDVGLNVAQENPVEVPVNDPWFVVDLNNNVSLKKELFVVDKDSIQYRFLGIRNITQEELFKPADHKARASGFMFVMFLMLLPGIVLFLYLRFWLKYLLMAILMGTLLFIVMELTKFRLKYKQMLNIALHGLTPVIIIETISSAVYANYLLPLPTIRFVGLNIYAVSFFIMALVMVSGIVGCKVKEKKK